MPENLVYNATMSFGQLLDHLDRGDTVLCPVCSARLVAALDDESQARLQLHPGIYCSGNIEHAIYVDIRPKDGFWDQFKK